MGEMSLYQQISKIESVIQYIKNIERDAKEMKSGMNDNLDYLRKNGLRLETAAEVEKRLMDIDKTLDEMLKRMRNEDLPYLEYICDRLKRAGNI